MTAEKPSVFISYAWDDARDFAHRASRFMERDNRVNVFIDKNNSNRDTIRSWIDDSVRKSDVALVLCTPSYFKKVTEHGTIERRPRAVYEYDIIIEQREQGKIATIPVVKLEDSSKEVVPIGLQPYPAVYVSEIPTKEELEHLIDEILRRFTPPGPTDYIPHPKFRHSLETIIKHKLERPQQVEMMFLHVRINNSSVNLFDHKSESETEEEQTYLSTFFDALFGGEDEETLLAFHWDRGQKYRTFAFNFGAGVGPTTRAVMELSEYVTKRLGLKANKIPREYSFTVFLTRGYAFFHPDPFKRGDMILDRLDRLPESSADVFYVDEIVFQRMAKPHQDKFFFDPASPIDFALYRGKELTRSSNVQLIESHVSRKEYIFALELAIRNHEQINDTESKLLLKHTLDLLESEVKRLGSLSAICPPLVAIRSLIFFAKSLCGTADDHALANDILTIRRLIDKSVSRYSDFHESYLFISGRSPLDPHIRGPLGKKFEEFRKTGTIHDDCCLCFARLGASGILSNSYKEHVRQIASWLKAKRDEQYRTQAGQPRDWRYTSKVLIFASLLEDRAWADDTLKAIVSASNWLDCSEWNSILERGGLLHSIMHYCMTFNIDARTLAGSERIFSELDVLVREIEAMAPAPICLDGLIGVVSLLRAELTQGRRDLTLESLVENQVDFMRKNTLWDKKTGTWGFEKQRTNYRIELWLEYTEWKCQLSSTSRGQHHARRRRNERNGGD
jgi:hypothetical protein